MRARCAQQRAAVLAIRAQQARWSTVRNGAAPRPQRLPLMPVQCRLPLPHAMPNVVVRPPAQNRKRYMRARHARQEPNVVAVEINRFAGSHALLQATRARPCRNHANGIVEGWASPSRGARAYASAARECARENARGVLRQTTTNEMREHCPYASLRALPRCQRRCRRRRLVRQQQERTQRKPRHHALLYAKAVMVMALSEIMREPQIYQRSGGACCPRTARKNAKRRMGSKEARGVSII